MSKNVEFIRSSSTLQEAAAKMKSLDVGPLPVCHNGSLVGMITDRDITVRATAEGEPPTVIRVRDIMTPEVISCHEDDDVVEAANVMEQKKVRRLVVLDRNDKMVGIVSLGDLAVSTGDVQTAGVTLGALSEPSVPRR